MFEYKPKTVVVNCKKEEYDVLIHRRTKWGNPYFIGKDGDRTEVINRYSEWIRGNTELLSMLPELIGKRLGCVCSPLPCHGDVLILIMKERGLI